MNKKIVSWIIVVLGVFFITKGLMIFFGDSNLFLEPIANWFFWGLMLVLVGREMVYNTHCNCKK